MIVVLAGRRIDAAGAETSRFPPENVAKVRESLTGFFALHKPAALICSAACGADLLALEAAGKLGVHRIVILPFPPNVFKEKSVADCAGNWTERYDSIYEEVQRKEEVIVLNYAEGDKEAYEKTNVEMLKRAESLLQTVTFNHEIEKKEIVAVAVWDGKPKSSRDATAHFMQEARSRNMIVEEISTLQ